MLLVPHGSERHRGSERVHQAGLTNSTEIIKKTMVVPDTQEKASLRMSGGYLERGATERQVF